MRTKAYRLLDKLNPIFKKKVELFLWEVNKSEEVIFVTESWRSTERQKELVKAGLSFVARSNHQDGLAIDIAFRGAELYPKEYNKWRAVADIAKKYQIEWGYDLWEWDKSHFQDNWLPMKEIIKYKNIPARPWYDFKNYPILNQGSEWECAGFAILGALIRMKDGVDYQRIAKELINEKWNELTMKRAGEWFMKKWYIKAIRKASYSKPLMMRQPLITQVFNVNWIETNKSPYTLVFWGRATVGSHWACISNWVIANSHGEDKYDKWYCYYTEEQRKEKMKVFYTIII